MHAVHNLTNACSEMVVHQVRLDTGGPSMASRLAHYANPGKLPHKLGSQYSASGRNKTHIA